MRIKQNCILLLLGIMSLSPMQVKGQIENETNSPRFKLEISGGFDHSVSKLAANHSVITSQEGIVESDLTSSKEDLKKLNRLNSYKLQQQSVDLRLSYRVWKDLSVWAGVGVITSSSRSKYPSDEELSSKASSENPELLVKGGLNYTYPLGGRFFMAARPSVSYSYSDNTLLTLYSDGEASVYRDYGLSRKVLRWEVPVIAGCKLGRFAPYVGVAYKDFKQTDQLDTETQYTDQTYDLSITDIYHSRSKVHGLAGTTFSLAGNIGIGLTATFSHSVAAELTFHLSL